VGCSGLLLLLLLLPELLVLLLLPELLVLLPVVSFFGTAGGAAAIALCTLFTVLDG
jgi:hypothetical protein